MSLASGTPTSTGDGHPQVLSIGALSRRTGVSPSTLRDWENHGILRPSRNGTHRRYSADDVARVNQALVLRQRNYSPAAIGALLGEAEGPEDSGAQRALARAGKRLRDARLSRGLRLTEVSQLAGVSMSHLSTIERSGTVPSLALLQRLALTYQIDVAELFGSPPDLSVPRVEGPEGGEPLVSDKGRVRVRPVARGNAICSDVYEADPGGGSGGQYSHIGEECVYVVDGEVEFWFGENDQRSIKAGESIAFDSSIPHGWCNTGSSTLRMFWSNARPATAAVAVHGQT